MENEKIIRAAEAVEHAVFVENCDRDTDGDGDCGRYCKCAGTDRTSQSKRVVPLTNYDVTADFQARHGGSWSDVSRHLWGD